ncbi:MAG TPA: PD-(D/E)XK nuclease family protein [Candidatus Absconditabacterales bacterium]|nr:PD-(D/E)XK nuclease family protein [Candidatus Absconditabacterales bacterium]
MQLPAQHELQEVLPISHISYSAVKSYCQDQQSFYTGYVLGKREDIEVKPSYVIGTAVHAGIELYWIHQQKIQQGAEVVDMTHNDFIILAQGQADHMIRKAEEDGTMVRGVTQNKETVMTNIKETLEAYLANPPSYIPLHTEIDDIVAFTDFEGIDMPVPLKVKIDMIAEDNDGNLIIVDHKTTSSGFEKEESDIAPDFDLQAGAYFIGCMSITGRAPTKIIFDQITKGKPNPFKGMLQKDLRELCDKHSISYEKYTKNEELKQKILDAGILETPDVIQKYEIDFTQNMLPVKAFIHLYKQIIMDLYVKTIYNVPFIINPFKQFGAEVGYKQRLQELA